MNEKDQSETERSKTSQSSLQTGAGPGHEDDDRDSITSGSPRNLVLVAAVVVLLFFAGVVFSLASIFSDSSATKDNWGIAETILMYVASAVFYAGVLVGLGTIAMARSKAASSRAVAVASLLSKAGAAIIIMAVAEAICRIGANDYYGMRWQQEASQVAFRVAARVYQAGVLAGLALLCLRRSKPRDRGGPRKPDRRVLRFPWSSPHRQ